MSKMDNFEKRVKGIRDWKGPEVDKLEAVHMIPYVIESYELITDLFTEVKRLRGMLYIAEQNIPQRIHWDCYIDALLEAGFEEGEEE